MNTIIIRHFISGKLNFALASFLLCTSFFAIAQNPTVINDSLVVNNRVYAKEKLIVDQEAKFKQDIKVLGTAKLIGDLVVDGVAKFNSNVKMEGLGSVTALTSADEIIVILPNGQLKKGNVGVLMSAMYQPIDCLPGDVPSPIWNNGLNKLYTPCPPVNVGIGTSMPAHKLHVVGVSYARNYLAGNVAATNAALFNGYALNDSQTLINLGLKIGALPEEVRFTIANSGETKLTNVSSGIALTINNGKGHAIVVNAFNGTKIFQLEDSGLLRTREIRVDAANWADFVFDTNYELPKLKDVAKFIETNHHLPGIPSSKELKETGLNVGEMQSLQMQKIEELTLYMIEMDKKMDAMQLEMDNLKKENSQLKQSISK